MGTTLKSIDNPQFNLDTLVNLKSFICIYHDDADTFFIRPETPKPGTSIDWQGEFWIRVDPETGEVTGLEIENFESIFIKKYPEVAKVWKEIKPYCRRKRYIKKDDVWELFIRVFLQLISGIFKEHPQQTSFKITPAEI